MKSSVAIVSLLAGVSGCKKERSVEMTLETIPREGQIVQDDFVELLEGQAIGVRVIGVKKDRVVPHWSVEARPENPAILRVQEVAGEKKKEDGQLFVFSAPEAGSTQIRFRLDGKHDVFVDAIVEPRDAWEPTVPPADFGGASGD
jgi:hypothetical protein